MPTIRAPEISAATLFGEPRPHDAVRAYEDTGAIIVRGLIPAEWIARLQDAYAHMASDAYIPFLKGEPTPQTRRLVNRHRMWEDHETFRDFLFNSPIAPAAAIMMRSNSAQLYEDILLTEPAGQKAMLGWHQDEPTWPVQGSMLSSVWFSLGPVGDNTGAMRFVKKSHTGPLFHPKIVTAEQAGDDVRFWTGGAFPTDAALAEEVVVLTDAQPGDAIIFHPRAIHSSYGSAEDRPRETFTIRFMGDNVRWLPKKRIFHPWMNNLGLREGDRIVNPRLPMVWQA